MLPLKGCFDIPKKKLSKKQRDEVGDLKIYLMEGKEAVVKTQVRMSELWRCDFQDSCKIHACIVISFGCFSHCALLT